MFKQLIDDVNPEAIRAGLKNRGFAFLPRRIGAADCAVLRGFIDAVPEETCEINYAGSEKRIWDAHRRIPEIEGFRAFSDNLLRKIFEQVPAAQTVLAYSNRPIPHAPELLRNRWHLDSLRRQIKVFAFLTPTTENSGPLELLEGSHKLGFKAMELLRGNLVDLSILTKGKRAYQQLSDRRIEKLLTDGRRAVPMLCDEGSIVIVNTSAIHRARPCFEAGRYAMTSYYGHF
jgi:Phytanoyl-CoA dioxygenase (PhyH)